MQLHVSSKFFIDQRKVLDAMERGEIRALFRYGGYTRKKMARSLRRRKRVARPGQTPSVHTKHKFRTLKNIRFAVNKSEKSVIVGAVKLYSSKVKGSRPLPEILEFGRPGVVEVDGRETQVSYNKFPFAGPTLDETVREGKLLEFLEDSMV